MNASQIITTEMTLEEKLEAIDKAMKVQAVAFNQANGRPIDAPVDPADLTMCEGCQ